MEKIKMKGEGFIKFIKITAKTVSRQAKCMIDYRHTESTQAELKDTFYSAKALKEIIAELEESETEGPEVQELKEISKLLKANKADYFKLN